MALPIWKRVAEASARVYPQEPYPRPQGVVDIMFDRESGEIGEMGATPEAGDAVCPTIVGTQPGEPYAKGGLSTGSLPQKEWDDISAQGDEEEESDIETSLDASPAPTYPAREPTDFGIPNPGPSS